MYLRQYILALSIYMHFAIHFGVQSTSFQVTLYISSWGMLKIDTNHKMLNTGRRAASTSKENSEWSNSMLNIIQVFPNISIPSLRVLLLLNQCPNFTSHFNEGANSPLAIHTINFSFFFFFRDIIIAHKETRDKFRFSIGIICFY